MKRIRRSSIGLVLVLGGLVAAGVLPAKADASDYHPAFQPDRLKGPPPGKANEVLVLGTPHLSGFKDDPRPDMLEPLLTRLAAWHPTAIATESLSGLQCDSLRRYPARYASTVQDYCPDTTAAAQATGLDVPAATAEAERLLAAWPAMPTPADRRHLAAVFLAAGEPASALVQWLRLEPAERREGDGLTAELAAKLDTLKNRRNETYLVAAPLAARLGLERVWSVDDHTADTPDPVDPDAYAAAITKAWDNPASKARKAEDQRLEADLPKPDGLLTMYRAYNAPTAPLVTYRSDFGAALMEPSPQAFGRGYVGYWETRNLRMVANIRDVLGQHPGTRLLAIVGASHKGYYEAYLNQMHDVHLVDSSAVLR
ncbi:DUF5694 domain-containing protein [Nitrospirillum sp. BR 11164]|uniref:DUF5694 domain-containing protein n=1 Tax=Nitrospirillum sp. BR 11164 TaxID=3104324 RepID=UPI002AFF847B|nr:DUF5694 domain-containing protein [Nitrospirillum sp. BR 11164]MEA1652536.1 DUF5694 domain-containing protein [Nitrospirillum sp. BR 11164]